MAAPGFEKWSTLPGNAYGRKTGTSVAAASVSRAAALLWTAVMDSNADGKLNDEVRASLEEGAAAGNSLRRSDLTNSLSLAERNLLLR
ncbi:MAG: hypothetical protein HYX84_06085 [Chloroflexi bacterium]|nr:hypothetical protein [Chloroflexota bacterium]